jgi:hypothetical protein
MSELRLDYEKNAPFPWLGLRILVLVLLAIIPFAFYFQSLIKRVNLLESMVEYTYSEKSEREAAIRSIGIGRVDLAQEIKNANIVLHRLSVPWEELFKAVESSSGSHVQLLALEPDFDKKQVQITGEADSYKSIMKYITELERHDVFGTVYLQNHEIRQEDPDKPVKFSLLANWKEKP